VREPEERAKPYTNSLRTFSNAAMNDSISACVL
jgi:hypothetical protein